MTHSERKSFSDELSALAESFVQGQRNGESDAELASAVIGLILQSERLRHGVSVGTVEAAAIDKQTIAKMQSWDSDDPTMSTLEKVLRRLANGRGDEAVALLERAIADRVKAVSEDQRRKAQAPRRKNPLDGLIEEIVRGKPDISAKELERVLRSQNSRKVIDYVDDDHIYLVDESFRGISVKSLKDRLTVARKIFGKAG